jgi:uncharacterized membrane protein
LVVLSLEAVEVAAGDKVALLMSSLILKVVLLLEPSAVVVEVVVAVPLSQLTLLAVPVVLLKVGVLDLLMAALEGLELTRGQGAEGAEDSFTSTLPTTCTLALGVRAEAGGRQGQQVALSRLRHTLQGVSVARTAAAALEQQ